MKVTARTPAPSRFDRVVLAAILANTVVLGWGWLDHAHELAAERTLNEKVKPRSW